MADQLLASLLYQAPNNLSPNCDAYNRSIACTQLYLNALAEAEGVNHNIYATGFDVDQIWMQSQVLLGKIRDSTYSSHILRADTKRKPQKKRVRRRTATQTKESPSSTHHEVIDQDPLESEGSSSDSGTTEAGVDYGQLNNHYAPTYNQNRSHQEENELDDGFFSIDAFNLETERFEQADELGRSFGELDTTIDWSVDPGDGDLDSDSPEDTDRTLMYTDFFPPPGHPGSRVGLNSRNTSAKRSVSEETISLEAIGGLMNEIERDLFDDMSPDQQIMVPGDSEIMDYSSHKSAQARLSDSIRQLEKQNINRREWMLSGETNSKQRPFNSLLQEDLDFERIGKPVPVVTQESTVTLEELIKGRIITERFDEIVRRNIEHHGKSRRSIVELEDSKSKVGLAEVYEQEHLETMTPTRSKSADVKSNALRSEIDSLFSTVSNQLDLLSSWHFTPKAPQPTLSVVQDVRTLNMEEMQVNANYISEPTSTALAPQEIYNPSSKESQTDGVIKVSGIPMSLSEVDRSRRTKVKSRREMSNSSRGRSRIDENAKLLKTLRKADVAVIDREGLDLRSYLATLGLSKQQKLIPLHVLKT
ncbi:U3 snoRNP protein [Orbilia oligospora]|uniref:U3 snoRNP protein n=1 Tax=Orbilia oligospora TaxID=2813651 RepID=A0A7C8KBJ3_ORBOL|nr:U3 snoRNP protein [Orbilia oligospora]KAF3201442.1 U3 snoRNP protein [Orbilia oligospora]